MARQWTDESAYPSIPFQYVFDRVQRPVPDNAEIVTAYTNGQVTLRSNRRTDGYHNAKDLSTYQGVEPGDFVVHGLDILRGSVGVSDSRGAMSPVCTVATAREGHDPRYHGYTIRAQAQSGYTKALARGIREGGADFRRWETLASLPLFAPPMHVQRRVADMLDGETARIDALIAKNRAVLETLHAREQAKVIALLPDAGLSTAKGTPRAALWLMDAEIQTGPFGSQLHQEEYVDDGVPVINPSHLVDGRLTPDSRVTITEARATALARHRMRADDVIFGRRGELGRAGMALANNEGWVVGTGCLRLRFLSPMFDPGFFLEVLSSPGVRAWFDVNSRGATMSNLNEELLGALPVPAIPLAEQRRVGSAIHAVRVRHREIRTKVLQQIDLMETRRRSLITSAVTGQITV